MHFTRMAGYRDTEVPIIVRGDGCYLEDASGKRYLDALAGLFSVNLGYSFGEEMGQAALDQMRELPFYTNWTYAHPRAIELASEVASLAPGDLNRVFFVSGGSEAVESAWKLARQYYLVRGERRLRTVLAEPETYHDAVVAAAEPRRRYKAMVGAFWINDPHYVWFMGMDPRPKQRSYKFWREPGGDSGVYLAALCIKVRTGKQIKTVP